MVRHLQKILTFISRSFTNDVILHYRCAFILLGTFAVQLLHGVACLRASMEPMDAMIFSTFRKYGKGIEYQEWLLDFQWQVRKSIYILDC